MTGFPTQDPDGFALMIRGRPEHLVSARMFAASVGRHLGAGQEQIEDLKLAVSEACTNAMQSNPTEAVTIEIHPEEQAVVVRIGFVAPDLPGFLGFGIIEALFGPILFRGAGSGRSIIDFSFRPEPDRADLA